MLEEKLPTKDSQDDSNGNNQRVSTPIRSLSGVMSFVEKIYNADATMYHKSEEIAGYHSLKPASIKQLLSTGQQYGLLELKHRQGYKPTPLFLKILKPLNDEEKLLSIMESLRSVKIYNGLFNDYQGHPLPIMNNLQNALERKYGVSNAASLKAAEVFIENINEYKLIDSNGILNIKNNPHTPFVNTEEKSKVANNTPPPEIPNFDQNETITLPIKLKGGRFASLVFPKNYDDNDIYKMYTVITAYLTAYSDSGDITGKK